MVKFIQHCDICQKTKSEHVKYLGMLQPIPVPEQSWQVVSLDFIEGLPRSSTFNCILVVMDKFSKYAHFVAMSHPFTALEAAEAYM